MIPPMNVVRSIPTTRCALLGLVVLIGCGTSASEVRRAERSGYRADFAIVYSEVLAVVTELYPQLEERPDVGSIVTAWHRISIKTELEGEAAGSSQQERDNLRRSQNDPSSASGNRVIGGAGYQRKRYFIQFKVNVIGGNPWEVRVAGKAQEWEEGSVPVELRGANEPHWLKGRTDALRVAIYRRLKKHAVLLPTAAVAEAAVAKPTVDIATFGNIPKAAAKRLAEVHTAASARDFTALRRTMANNLSWSFGAEPSADQAIHMWRADSAILTKLVEVLEAGCHSESERRVTCPPAYSQQPGYLGYRAGLELIGDEWKMIFFVTGD